MSDNYGNPRYNRPGRYRWQGGAVIAFVLYSLHSFGQIDSVSIKTATTAYNQFRLKESRALFEKIAGYKLITPYVIVWKLCIIWDFRIGKYSETMKPVCAAFEILSLIKLSESKNLYSARSDTAP